MRTHPLSRLTHYAIGPLCYTRNNFDDSDPATGDNITNGAQEIREKGEDLKERLNNLLSVDATPPDPPATLADADSQIPGDGATPTPDPLRIDGDRVDLRGCTYRTVASVTDGNERSASVVAYANVTNLQLTVTPVSASSLLIFTVQALVHMQGNQATTELRDHFGRMQVRNTTAGADLSPAAHIGVSEDARGAWWTTLVVQDTGRTGANVYDVQISVNDITQSPVIYLLGDIEPSHFSVVEHV